MTTVVIPKYFCCLLVLNCQMFLSALSFFFILFYFIFRLLKDCPGFVFTPRSREELPPNFPSDIPGICHFLDAYQQQGPNSKPWFQQNDVEDGNANFLGKASGVD